MNKDKYCESHYVVLFLNFNVMICNLVQGNHHSLRNRQIFSFPQILLMTFLLQCRYISCSCLLFIFINIRHLTPWNYFWQISHKYSLIYVITKLGLLFVYDLETATAVYRNRISPDPIFLTAEASSVGGFYAINRRGQVLLATVNEQTIVNFVSGQVCLWPCYHFYDVKRRKWTIF